VRDHHIGTPNLRWDVDRGRERRAGQRWRLSSDMPRMSRASDRPGQHPGQIGERPKPAWRLRTNVGMEPGICL